MLNLRKCRIGIVGLGYVGLPLAVEFGKHFDTTGFDVKKSRIAELEAGKDSTLETTRAELKAATQLRFTSDLADLKRCRVFIVTVPTPIDEYKRPDLTPLVRASESVGNDCLALLAQLEGYDEWWSARVHAPQDEPDWAHEAAPNML